MPIDPENVVVKLCASGMQAETEGRMDDAKRLYEQAWSGHSTDYEACIAAHYLARRQSSIEDEFEWNKVALTRARCVDSDLIGGFYASLYLNVAYSYEKLGNLTAARQHLQSAQHHLEAVPDGPYKEIVRGGIENALSRIRQDELGPEPG